MDALDGKRGREGHRPGAQVLPREVALGQDGEGHGDAAREVAVGDRMANPGWRQLPVLAASLVALGRIEEARALMAPLAQSAPWLTPEKLAAARPYRDPGVMATMIARLAEAAGRRRRTDAQAD